MPAPKKVVMIPFIAQGKTSVAVVALERRLGKVHLLLTKTTGKDESWALRDYTSDLILRSGSSDLLASEIEAEVTHAAPAAYRSVERKRQWAADCKLISENHYGKNHVDTINPAAAAGFGKWRKMNSAAR